MCRGPKNSSGFTRRPGNHKYRIAFVQVILERLIETTENRWCDLIWFFTRFRANRRGARSDHEVVEFGQRRILRRWGKIRRPRWCRVSSVQPSLPQMHCPASILVAKAA